MKVLTYNVHGCVGMDGFRSYSRIAEVIAEAKPDVVALQELDVGRMRSQGIHQARVIAELLEMEYHFHPALRVRDEEYGDALLSKYPMRLLKAGPLPPGPPLITLEPRGALLAEVSAPDGEWQILTTHFGLGRVERYRQARALAGEEWMGLRDREKPFILCGDLNSRAGSGVHTILRQELRDAQSEMNGRSEATFSTLWQFICLDYIFVSSSVEVVQAKVIRTEKARVASDHFPLFAELRNKRIRRPGDGEEPDERR